MKTLVRNYDLFPSLLNDLFLENTSPIRAELPSANIKENDSSFEIALAIPGFKKEDFKIEVNDRNLTVSSEEKTENEKNNEQYIRKEFNYSSFSRSFKLPRSVDSDQISAVYENGVLNLNLPKREEAKIKEPRLIAID